MIKKFIAIALLLPLAVWARVPEEEDILEQITDSKGEFYYPDLMLRFEMGDTTLSAEQYHYLYYGYTFQEEYKPLEANPQMNDLIVLASQIDPEKPSVETLESIINIADQILKRDPFNPKVWNILAFAYGSLNDKIKEREAYDRVEKILQTIDNSGDGLREKSPKHILMFDHAIDLMSSQSYITTKPMIISREVEFLPLVSPIHIQERKVKGFYFDYSRVYISRPDSVIYKRERTWQFNDLKPKSYK